MSKEGLSSKNKRDYGGTGNPDVIRVAEPEHSSKACCNVCGIAVTKTHVVVVVIALVILLAALGVGLFFGLSKKAPTEDVNGTVDGNGTTQSLAQQQSFNIPSFLNGSTFTGSASGVYENAAIAIDAPECAEIAVNILEQKNGTAVDAAIASLLCNGLVNSNSMGIGGGFLMTIYLRETGEVVTLNARETAPLATTLDLYTQPETASLGIHSGGVPGEIKGYWEAKQRYGNPDLPWRDLFQPAIDMCRNGITVHPYFADKLASSKDNILSDPGMREVFINPGTGDVWQTGDSYTRLNLGDTLERIAIFGEGDLYGGFTGQKFVEDMASVGGIITEEDLSLYNVSWGGAVELPLDGYTAYSHPLPGGGPVYLAILNILQHYNITSQDDNPVLYHRIVEAFKYGYAERTKMGDPADETITQEMRQLVGTITSSAWGQQIYERINDTYTVNDPAYYGATGYAQTDQGTAHVAIVAPNGDAVSVTSTINGPFGANFMSPYTGILLNNEMDDFSFPDFSNTNGIPPSTANFPKPGKRPLSSMAPSIVVDDETGQVTLVIGGSGGTEITTTTAYTSLRQLWLAESMKEALDAHRVHHQLTPMEVSYETGFAGEVLDYLANAGHVLSETDSIAIMNGVARTENGLLEASSDFRKNPGVAGF